MELTGLFLTLYFSICGGFLLDGKTQPPPTQGSVITDANFDFLMQFIIKERQSRLQLEAEVKHLKEEVKTSKADLNSRIDQLKRFRCAADTTNNTNILEGKVNTLQQNINALTNDNIKQKQENVLIQNKSVELEHEVMSLKYLKGVSDLTTVLNLHNQSKHLETEIQLTNSRLSAITAEANARKQDFLALFQKVQTNEECSMRNTGDINKQLNKTSQLFESHIKDLNSSLTQVITNFEKETDMLNKTMAQNKVHSFNRMNSIENWTRRIQNNVTDINNKALVIGFFQSGQHSDTDIIKIANVAVSYGFHGVNLMKTDGAFACEKTGYYLFSVKIFAKKGECGVIMFKNSRPLATAHRLVDSDDNYIMHFATVITHLYVGDGVLVRSYGGMHIVRDRGSLFSVLQVAVDYTEDPRLNPGFRSM